MRHFRFFSLLSLVVSSALTLGAWTAISGAAVAPTPCGVANDHAISRARASISVARPAALISASSSHLEQDAFGAGVNARLDWLSPQPASEGVEGTYTQADLNTFAAFGVKPPGRG